MKTTLAFFSGRLLSVHLNGPWYLNFLYPKIPPSIIAYIPILHTLMPIS